MRSTYWAKTHPKTKTSVEVNPPLRDGKKPVYPFTDYDQIAGHARPLLKCIYRGRDNVMSMALNADSTIAELLREKPDSAQVLFRFGMGCLGCAIANSETIREAAQVHGIPLEELLSALGVAEA